MMRGMVYLVGAGPGDWRLATLRAVECLRRAEVVVYDHLASEQLLRYAPEAAERVYVGKQSAHHTLKQEEISQLLVDKAKEGKTVVRLKGGDPFVFGRGGEEGMLLAEHGIPFEVVPGVTSAIAVPAYAGIPVTHRGIARSFAVVTGHKGQVLEERGIDWQGLAQGPDTLIFLMGVENLPKITAKLIEHGHTPGTPAAVIRWGTSPEQQTLVTTLKSAAEDVQKAGILPPAIFVVGEVVRLREKLRWFDLPSQRPLLGKRILVTRSRNQASRLTAALEDLGAAVREVPTIAIEAPADGYAALDAAIEKIVDYQWLIFTSVNGVTHFFQRLEKAGKDTRALGYAQVAAIGQATAAELARYGIKADVVPREYRAEALLEALKGKLPAHAHILIPRAAEAREILPEKLREQGIAVEVVPAYRTVIAEADGARLAQELATGEIEVVTFTSSSTVRNLVKILGSAEPLKQAQTACIGPVTAGTLREQGVEPTVVASEYTIAGLVEAIKKLGPLPEGAAERSEAGGVQRGVC